MGFQFPLSDNRPEMEGCLNGKWVKGYLVFRFNETPFSNDLLLPSPSQAFSNFNLNSPTTNVTHSNSNHTIIGSPTNNEHPLKACSKPLVSQGEKHRALGVFVPKSFTVNSLKDVDKVNLDSCKMDLTCTKENALSNVVYVDLTCSK